MSSDRNWNGIKIKKGPQNEKHTSTDDMSSITASILSYDHFASSRASMEVDSLPSMELGSLQSSQTEDDVMETSTLGSSNTTSSFRKRKAATLMPLQQSLVEGVVLPAATRDPKDKGKDFTGLTTIPFPLKLHRVLHEYELNYEETQKKHKLETKKKKAKVDKGEQTKSTNTSNGNEKIFGWIQSGTSFQIFDQERFVDEILPMYFSETSFREFQKDLALWGFTSKSSVAGPPTRVLHFCSHPLFIKSQPGLCHAMRFGGMLHSQPPDHTAKRSFRDIYGRMENE